MVSSKRRRFRRAARDAGLVRLSEWSIARGYSGPSRNARGGASPPPESCDISAASRDSAWSGEAVLISLIISTRNRAAQLSRCLHHVGLIRTDTPWELVVVDNGSTDGTADGLGEFARRGCVPLRIGGEPVPGVTHARHAGLREARGEIVG